MSSGFSGGGGSDYFSAVGGGFNGRSPSSSSVTNNMNITNSQNPYRSLVAGGFTDPSYQLRPDLIGKRTLAEFQTHNLQQQQQNSFNIPQNLLQQQQQKQNQQNQQLLGLYLRSVKPRIYQNSSPISPLSPIDFSNSIMPEIPSFSSRYGIPMTQNLRSQPMRFNNSNNYPNLIQEPVVTAKQLSETETETENKKLMNQLQDLEKELLGDLDDCEQHCDDVSVITAGGWNETIQSLLIPPSPSSSSSTCCSSTSLISPSPTTFKQSLMEAASAIIEGKTEVAAEIIARVTANQGPNSQGSSEQRMMLYMTAALKSRLTPPENSPQVSDDKIDITQLLFQHSSCFKLGLMAANLAIIESTAEIENFHIVDFNIGQGFQYQSLLQRLSLRKSAKPTLVKITAVDLSINGEKQSFLTVGEKLSQLGSHVGISIQFKSVNLSISDLGRESLCSDQDEVLIVNLAHTLYKIADESVSTDNPRDHLLRRVKGLKPRVVTMAEQELNCNTTQLVSRVNECCNYYGALLDSLDSSLSKDNSERVNVERGLSQKIINSVACEGKERVERCEVFGKWRARMSMAGFEIRPVSQPVSESLKGMVNSSTRVNPNFTVKEENGGVCFGWMGRTLTVASAWR